MCGHWAYLTGHVEDGEALPFVLLFCRVLEELGGLNLPLMSGGQRCPRRRRALETLGLGSMLVGRMKFERHVVHRKQCKPAFQLCEIGKQRKQVGSPL